MLREGDIFLRYDGEEFVIVYPGASLRDLSTLSERARRIVEGMETSYNSQKIKVTVSIGGTSYPEHDVEDSSDLLQLSDTKVYQAKESGRNLVMIE